MIPIRDIISGTGLPLAPLIPDIMESLEKEGAIIVRADPGIGKSTLIPLALAGFTRRPGKIILLEPRRASTITIAQRLADLLSEPPGKTVGYSIRGEKKVSPGTVIEVLTLGLFLRRLQNDPDLLNVSHIIFDEFHERSAEGDLILGMILNLRSLGSPVKIIIMSATMDARSIADFLNTTEDRKVPPGVPLIECSGTCFPVDIEYMPLPHLEKIGIECARAIIRILELEKTVHPAILVFLPGKGEIEDARQYLLQHHTGGTYKIEILHGGIPAHEQKRIISGDRENNPRIILSTNIAETGITLPGVTLVIDSGLVRLERYHLPSAMNRLSLEAASKHSADQRAGRAGRLMPGRCIRLWDKNDIRPVETEPEIRRIDLSRLVLESLIWGAKKKEDLPWLEIPRDSAWGKAAEMLTLLGAADDMLSPTENGRIIAGLGIEVRLGVLCLEAKKQNRTWMGCVSASMLSESFRYGKTADPEDSSFISRMEWLRRNPGSNQGRPVFELAGDLYQRMEGRSGAPVWTMDDEAELPAILAAAFPDRIAALQPATGKYRFVSGREAVLPGYPSGDPWITALEVDAGERTGKIRLAVPVNREDAFLFLKPFIQEEISLAWKGLEPRTLVRITAGRLVLREEQRQSFSREVKAELPLLLEKTGLSILPWEEDGGKPGTLLSRIRFFVTHNTRGISGWTDDDLIKSAGEWLGPFIWGGEESGKTSVISGKDLADALEARAGWEMMKSLHDTVPEYFEVPGKKKRRIDYSSGEPVVNIRLQDALGISKNPVIMHIPVVFHLLSPADRPIQVTKDLMGFWAGSYQEVRKEMKGRYPKHHWPENPLS